MPYPPIIDALFSIPRVGTAQQIPDCIPLKQDIGQKMNSEGVAGAVVAPCNCSLCQHRWNCADRRTHEVQDTVARSPKRLRGLACYDQLRIGDSLRWIDSAVSKGELAGAYAQAEFCVSGVNSARMYPLYGLCARMRAPMVIEIASQNDWTYHRPQVEVVAADFPELDIVLAPPERMDWASVLRLMEQFPRISVLLSPEKLRQDSTLREYIELKGRERVMFRSGLNGWPTSVETARELPLGPAARLAYLAENCSKLFGFPAEVMSAGV
ncbi:MAG TPA: amidohydrolase family protein [Candidatus Saccharimonadales bacterium]|nr:amidohydrolase family protein [Candidatus Saccharimonadales bacterium]